MEELNSISLLEAHSFPDKQAQKSLLLCLPGGGTGYLYPIAYPPSRTILSLPRKFYYVVADIGYGAYLILQHLTVVPDNWVTERVFEKQTLRDFIQCCINGLLPDGSALSTGTADSSVFPSASGAFKYNWSGPQSNFFGSSPMATVFGILGRISSGDISMNTTSLQVCDAALNNIKASIMSGEDFINADKFYKRNTKQKVSYLTNAVTTFSYVR